MQKPQTQAEQVCKAVNNVQMSKQSKQAQIIVQNHTENSNKQKDEHSDKQKVQPVNKDDQESKETKQNEKAQRKQRIRQKKQKAQQAQKDYQQQQVMPDKFYDSDLASVNEKDFQSDNEPPKDLAKQRKLLFKQKQLHVYKTIIKVGNGIDKPARFDEIKLRFKQQENTKAEGVQQALQLQYLKQVQFITYHLGKDNFDIERLVTSMKAEEQAVFQVQFLEVSKKSNIKVLKQKQVFVIEVQTWTTVIDINNNENILKFLIQRGEGPYRVSKYDEISFTASFAYKNQFILEKQYQNLKLELDTISTIHPLIWLTLQTMKNKQISCVRLNDADMKQICQHKIKNVSEKASQKQLKQLEKIEPKQQTQNLKKLLLEEQLNLKASKLDEQNKQQENSNSNNNRWQMKIEIKQLISIDDIFMDGTLLKKLIVKGVSTAKPDSSSLVYYALKFIDNNKKVIYEDPCFNSDWWEDYSKLDILGCRKNYLDDYKVTPFLKAAIKRMKPGEISQIECRKKQYFQTGQEYEQLKKRWPEGQQLPSQKVYLIVRVYNFTQGRNCFNMDIQGKVQESQRRRLVAIKQLEQGHIEKALKSFQGIVAFFNSGDINQKGYDEKISALMNAILCLMKQNKYAQMIPLCNIVLESPKHGFNQDKMKIKATGIKVEGSVDHDDNLDTRQPANLEQNAKIIDKCLYRKALALLKIGESKQAIQTISKVVSPTNQTEAMKKEAEKHFEKYQQKSKKLYQGMFGA